MQNNYATPHSILQRPYQQFQPNYLNQPNFQLYQPQNEVELISSIHHTDTIHFYADKVEVLLNFFFFMKFVYIRKI